MQEQFASSVTIVETVFQQYDYRLSVDSWSSFLNFSTIL